MSAPRPIPLALSLLLPALLAFAADGPDVLPPAAAATSCLSTHDGYLKARVRGAIDLDIDWHDADMQCDGGVRPDGQGERVTFVGAIPGSQRRVRFVFGIATSPAASRGHGLPTNLTIIFEGEQKLFSTRGDDKCTIDEFTQQPATPGISQHRRASARGFCVAPATALTGDSSVLVTRFDFAGAVFDEGDADESLHARN